MRQFHPLPTLLAPGNILRTCKNVSRQKLSEIVGEEFLQQSLLVATKPGCSSTLYYTVGAIFSVF